MDFNGKQVTIVRLQWLVWSAVYFIMFFSIIPGDCVYHGATITAISVAFYLLVIYGNIDILYPCFYEKGKKAIYVLLSGVLLITGGTARGYLIMYLQ